MLRTLKRLNEGVDQGQRNYIFSGKVGNNSLNTIVSATNNLNQITGRSLLGIYNLLSYFGLSKDPSEKFSKAPSVFDKFSTLLRGGNNNDKLQEELKNLLIQQNVKIERLETMINHLSNKEEISIKSEVSNLTEIKEYLKRILG